MSDGPTSPGQPADDNAAATLRAYADATREIMRVVAESRHDEKPVFEAILEAACRLCDAPNAGLVLLNTTGDTLVLHAKLGEGLRRYKVGEAVWPVDGRSPNAIAVRENQAVYVEDLANTAEYRAGTVACMLPPKRVQP